MIEQNRFPCPDCYAGSLNPARAFLFSVRGGYPLCIPNFPAWVCDVCRYREYDLKSLTELETLLFMKTTPASQMRTGSQNESMDTIHSHSEL